MQWFFLGQNLPLLCLADEFSLELLFFFLFVVVFPPIKNINCWCNTISAFDNSKLPYMMQVWPTSNSIIYQYWNKLIILVLQYQRNTEKYNILSNNTFHLSHSYFLSLQNFYLDKMEMYIYNNIYLYIRSWLINTTEEDW
jgi:hypothetical protein